MGPPSKLFLNLMSLTYRAWLVSLVHQTSPRHSQHNTDALSLDAEAATGWWQRPNRLVIVRSPTYSVWAAEVYTGNTNMTHTIGITTLSLREAVDLGWLKFFYLTF